MQGIYSFDLEKYLHPSAEPVSSFIKKIVIKPTNKCTANCGACASRRSTYSTISRADIATREDWYQLFHDLENTRLERVILSGGEPTLYPRLFDLIQAIKQYGWHVSINTNGWHLKSESFFRRLVTSGVNCVTISIDSANPQVHDHLRELPGLWNAAIIGLERLVEYNNGAANPLEVNVRAILSRYTYRDLPNLVDLCFLYNVNALMLSYIEADFSRLFLLSEEQIIEFKRDVVPRIAALVLSRDSLDEGTRQSAIKKFQDLFPPQVSSLRSFSQGVYWTDESAIKRYCSIPFEFALVTPKGDVYPCNAIEYFGKPVVGNIRTQSFGDIWGSREFEMFRKHKCEWCQVCPMNLHTVVLLK